MLKHFIFDILVIWPAMYIGLAGLSNVGFVALFVLGTMFILSFIATFFLDSLDLKDLSPIPPISYQIYSYGTGIIESIIFLYFQCYGLYFCWVCGLYASYRMKEFRKANPELIKKDIKKEDTNILVKKIMNKHF